MEEEDWKNDHQPSFEMRSLDHQHGQDFFMFCGVDGEEHFYFLYFANGWPRRGKVSIVKDVLPQDT